MILCRCQCGQVFNVEPSLAGTEAECPSCHRLFTFPETSDPDVVLPAAVPATDAPAEAVAPQEEGEPEVATPSAADGGGTRLRLRKGSAGGTDGEAGEAPEPIDVDRRFPAPPPSAPTKKGGLGKRIVRTAVAIVVLALGYKFGFGPILMSLLDRPALVVVKNGESANYEAILGWRRVSQELPAGAVAPFRIYVGMAETQTLTLRPLPPGTGEVQKIKVKVSPGCAVLVNVGQKTTFWLIDENSAKTQRVDTELRKLVEQLGANAGPAEAEAMVNAVRRVVRESIKGQNTDLLIDLNAYRMDELMGLMPAATATVDKLLLTAIPVRRLAFANGGVNVSLAQTENIDGQIELPAFVVSLRPEVTVNVPARQPLQILRTARTLRLSMQIKNQLLKVRKGEFPGTWDYTANYRAGVLPADAWRWQWTFNGAGILDGEKVRVNALWNMQQMPTVQIDKVGAK